MKRILFCSTLIVLILSCGKDDNDSEATGALRIHVRHKLASVGNAQITTIPITRSVRTDLITGKALISDIPIGGYKINVAHQNIGSGSTSVTVVENETTEITLQLIEGLFETPTVSIDSPGDLGTYDLGADLEFSATIGDNIDPPSELTLVWSSSKDGVLNAEPASTNGNTSFTTNSLSLGEHEISLRVTDSDNLVTTRRIKLNITNLPNVVQLSPISPTPEALKLDWSESDDPDFQHYKIDRSEDINGPYQALDFIPDINTTTYLDETVEFGVRYFYRIVVRGAGSNESNSNIESLLFEGDFIDIGVKVDRMILDPIRPYIYALDKNNNSLLFIDKESRTLEKTIFIGANPTDIDINLNNSKAYVANLGSNKISVVDLETQEKINELTVDVTAGNWEGNPFSLVYLKGDYIAYTSEDQWNQIKIVDAETGSLISFDGIIHTPFLETNEAKDVIYALNSLDVVRFDVNQDGTITQLDETELNMYSPRNVIVTKNGQFIFRGKYKIQANDLSKVLGTFDEDIYASNDDGSLVVGEGKIWNGDNYSIQSILPVDSPIVEFDHDNESIIIYDTNTSKIYFFKI